MTTPLDAADERHEPVGRRADHAGPAPAPQATVAFVGAWAGVEVGRMLLAD